MWTLKNMKGQKLTQAQQTAYDRKVTHDMFEMTIEWLEKYIEIAYKGEFPDWEKRKQIRNSSIKRQDIIGNPEIAEETFSVQLFLFQSTAKSKSLSIREELKQEFYKWIGATGINSDNCPERLKHFLFGINEILEGRGEKVQRDAENGKEFVDSNSPEYMKGMMNLFSNTWSSSREEIEVEKSLRGKTSKDIKIVGKFSGDEKKGQKFFGEISGEVSDNHQSFHFYPQKDIDMDIDDSSSHTPQSVRINLIKNIKENIKDWKIKNITVSLGCHWIQNSWKRVGKELKKTMLIHETIKKEYDHFGGLVISPEKMKLRDGFSDSEWLEISEARRVFVEDQFGLVQKKLAGEVKPEYWETEEGIAKWKNQLEVEIRDNWLLTDEQIRGMSDIEVSHLIDRLNKELKKREVGQSWIDHLVSSRELREQLNNSKSILNNNNNNNNNNNQFPKMPLIIGSLGISLLLTGLIVYKVKKNKIKK
jgi:hypothetical protein